MATVNLQATGVVTFQSKDHLAEAFYPLGVDEVHSRTSFEIGYDGELVFQSIVPLRNPGIGRLVDARVYEGQQLEVYYPESPRVPHHLAIAMKRNVSGTADLNERECQELFSVIRRIAEIYKTVGIQGFVIAQYDRSQEGHMGRYVIEVIPHLPGFEGVKNIVDKIDCNRHVLFRQANISPIVYPFETNEVAMGRKFWQGAFAEEYDPLERDDVEVSYPFVRRESHQKESEEVLSRHLLEMLQNKGGEVRELVSFNFTLPTKFPEEIKTISIAKCFFCDEGVIQRQLVFEYKDILVFYNIRKGAKPGSNFLVLPRRHTQKVYGLTPEEIENIRVVRGALVEVLNETHPECEVVIYIQDDPSIGQTVFHSHEQVVAINPKTVALTWTMMCLYPTGNVSDEEMERVKEDFSQKLYSKLSECEKVVNF